MNTRDDILTTMRLTPRAVTALAAIEQTLHPGRDRSSAFVGSVVGSVVEADAVVELAQALESLPTFEGMETSTQRGLLEAFCELWLFQGPTAASFSRTVPRLYAYLCAVAARHPDFEDRAHGGAMESLLYNFGLTRFAGASHAELERWRAAWSSPSARASFDRALHHLGRAR